MIAEEIRLTADEDDQYGADRDGLRQAKIGDFDVEVLTDEGPDGKPRSLAILATPRIEQHLLLYARTLWRRR